jgi:hypothetical protein
MKHDARNLEIIANRKRFVHELRTTHEEQTKFSFRSLNRRSYCAVGFCYYVVMGEDMRRFQLSSKVATHLGLSHNQLRMIMAWNDSGRSFAEIAEKFEKADFPISESAESRESELKKSLKSLLALMQSDFGTMETPLAPMKSRVVPMERASSGPPKRRKEQLNRGREKEAGRITLEQWLERYGGDPQAFEHSA